MRLLVLLSCVFCWLHVCGVSTVHSQQTNLVNLYISQSGSDNNLGNSTSLPFLTVSKAATWIQNYKNTVQKQNTTFIVNIDDGRYFVNSTITIGKSSKFNDKYSPVYWKPWRSGGDVTFTGGVPLPPHLWSTVSNQDPQYDMLPPSAKGNVLKLNLTTVGFSASQIIALQIAGFSTGGGSSGNELFFQRKVQTTARFPNMVDGNDKYLRFTSTDGVLNFTFDASSSPNRDNWSKETHPFAFAYWYHDWADGLYPLKSISGTGVGEVFSKPGYGIKVKQRFFLSNFLSELDQPGEYVILDGVIYFWPPSQLTKFDDVIISVSENIFEILANANSVSNINFEMCRGIAIIANSLRDVSVTFTTISNVGNRGIVMSSCQNNCQAISNVIYESGQGGISVGGGVRATLTPCNCLIMNNTVFNYSRIGKTYRAAIGASGVGVIVRNNEIYNGDHLAISWGGNNIEFSYNVIHSVCKSTGDSGAIYSGRDWTMRGNIMRYNHIYNVNGPGDLGTTCIYLDDQFSSVTMYGNILEDCYRGLLIGGGRDNIVYGNVFINNSISIHADSRGLSAVGPGEIDQKLTQVPYNSSTIWIESYPTLANILNDEPNAPKGNIVQFNAFVGKTSTNINANFIKYSQYSNNSNVPESIFINSRMRNFTVTEQASAQYLKGVTIPFSSIGLLPYSQNSITPTSSDNSLKPSGSNRTIISESVRVEQNMILMTIILVVCILL